MLVFFQEPLFVAILCLTGFLLVNLCVSAEALEYHRISTLSVSLVALILGLLSCLSFDKGVTGFQFTDSLSTI
jgi:purine-cytosine permease-like protein